MLLDASQAFDNVQYTKLFTLLLERNLCPMTCRVLLNMQTGQAVRVRWGHSTSPSFSVRNGVKQGGILSPILFTIYADRLLSTIAESRQGCHLGNVYAGAVGYADDIALLAPTRSSMSTMLKHCAPCWRHAPRPIQRRQISVSRIPPSTAARA
jgi:hypothetical protein